MIGVGIIEVNHLVVGVDPGDNQEMIRRGALVVAVQSSSGIDPGDHFAVGAEVLL